MKKNDGIQFNVKGGNNQFINISQERPTDKPTTAESPSSFNIAQIKEFVKENDLVRALSLLLEEGDEKTKQLAILLFRRKAAAEEQYLRGTLPHEDYSQELNRIANAILQTIDN